MPRRSGVGPAEFAEWGNLARAWHRAATGKRDRRDVSAFGAELGASLDGLRRGILDGTAPAGRFAEFEIRDPKPRRILAPCFADRVVHHAVMAHVGPVLDRGLIDDTFACRVGRGTLAAVQRTQQHARRFGWYVKADVRSFFASIDHATLLRVLARRFKHPDTLALFERVLSRTPDGPPRGLPIGALTSQHFANAYLGGFDRLLTEQLGVRAMVRYMDDVVWWCDSCGEARRTLRAARSWLAEHRRLELKPDAVVQRSDAGVSFLGFRVYPGTLKLSSRRRRRYASARAKWERAYLTGSISALELQRGYDSALAVTAHADATVWRGEQMRRRGTVDV